MPTLFDILKERSIVYVQHCGHVTVAESTKTFSEFARHPDFVQGQMHLLDCSTVTSFERNYPDVMALQAQIADVVTAHEPETLLVIYAPTEISLRMAKLIKNSWDGSPTVIPRIVQTEAEALSILGQPENTISDLLAGFSVQGS